MGSPTLEEMAHALTEPLEIRTVHRPGTYWWCPGSAFDEKGVDWNLERLAEAGIEADGLWVYGDMAYNHATMCSPEMYRDLIWPDHRRLAAWTWAGCLDEPGDELS